MAGPCMAVPFTVGWRISYKSILPISGVHSLTSKVREFMTGHICHPTQHASEGISGDAIAP